MATFKDTSEFREAQFLRVNMAGAKIIDADLSGAVIRDAVMAGIQMHGVLIPSGEITGEIVSLRINGIEVAPFVEAELDRLNPERPLLRSDRVEDLREAWAILRSQWAQTVQRATKLAPEDLDRSVNDEWSFKQTLRHLIYATDSWLGTAIRGEANAFHPMGITFTGGPSSGTAGADVPFPFDEILAVREERQDQVASFLDSATREDLERQYGPHTFGDWPPREARTGLECIHVIMNEEWWHNRFANRDLDIIVGAAQTT